jgi:hypothetical protein
MPETAVSSSVTRCLPTVPAPVSVDVATFQTAAGSAVIEEAIEVRENPSEDDAASTVAFVFAFTFAEPAVMAAAIEVEAVVTVAFTLDVALLISLLVASEPVVRPAPVRVRVADAQTSAAMAVPDVRVRVPEAQISATNVPKEDSVRALYDQIESGSEAPSEEDAVRIALLVFVLTKDATDVDETMFEVI